MPAHPAPVFDPHRCDRARRALTFVRDEPATQSSIQWASRRPGEPRVIARARVWSVICVLADAGCLVRLPDARWAITARGLQLLTEAAAFDAAPADWPVQSLPTWILAA